MSTPFFSLEIGEESVKVGDFDVKGNAIMVNNAGIAPLQKNIYLSDTDDILRETEETVQKLLIDTKIAKKSVNIIIPDSQSYSRIIEMPLLTEKELVSAIRYQADQFIPIPIDKANLDVEILYEDKNNKKLCVLLVAAGKNIVSKLSSIVEKIGLYPEVLEPQMSASLRFCEYILSHSADNKKNPSQPMYILFMNMGFTSTSLYLFNKSSLLPVQNHIIPIGRDIFMKEIKSNTQLEDNKINELLEIAGFDDTSSYKLREILHPGYQELSGEIIRYLQSLREKNTIIPSQLLIFGDGAKIKGLSGQLQTSLGIQTTIFDIIPYLHPSPIVEYLKNSWPSFIPVIGANIQQTS